MADLKARLYGKKAPPVGTTPSVVLVNPKFPHNVAAAIRAASCFGIEQVWFTGDRVGEMLEGKKRLPREERMKGYGEVELIQFDYPLDAFPKGTVPVAVELLEHSELLPLFQHPEGAVYVFGPEDGGLGKVWRKQCHRFVTIPSRHCMNLAASVYTVLYSRAVQMYMEGRAELPALAEERGFGGERI